MVKEESQLKKSERQMVARARRTGQAKSLAMIVMAEKVKREAMVSREALIACQRKAKRFSGVHLQDGAKVRVLDLMNIRYIEKRKSPKELSWRLSAKKKPSPTSLPKRVKMIQELS